MAKPNHAKRSRPRPVSLRQRRARTRRGAELRAQREIDRWRRAS